MKKICPGLKVRHIQVEKDHWDRDRRVQNPETQKHQPIHVLHIFSPLQIDNNRIKLGDKR